MIRYRARMVIIAEGVLEDAVIGVDDGLICELGRGEHTVDLGDVVIVPGIINAHSHAFQRAIRGRTEYLDATRPDDDFWSWRDRMYGAALKLTPEDVRIVSRMAFLEMALSGVTTVGEFHYVHHQPDGTPYDDPNELAHQVIDAARDVGMRISLLRVGYQRAGHGRPFLSSQRRFVESDVDTYLSRVEALAGHWSHDHAVTVGMAPHSVRAVPSKWLEAIGRHGATTGRVIHIHGCEQRRELVECQAEYGRGPMSVFADLGLLSDRTTIVHGTHLDTDALCVLDSHRPTICACPTTERNLGDGFLPTKALLDRNIPIALGSDGQSQIDLWTDARLIEYNERLRDERRNVVAAYAPAVHGRQATVEPLWPMLNRHGARSLGINAGDIAVGKPADFVALDLNDPSLIGTDADHVMADCVFSVTPRAVHSVFVGGRPIVSDGQHANAHTIGRDFADLMRRLAYTPLSSRRN